ncbi:hypothetical protein EBR21_06260 [bacterium]|nr:hypothetical protein [bacterium]
MVSSLGVLAACGMSRSTRSTSPCSTTQSIVDNRVSPGTNLENYDPTAVLLLFKATSDKMAIESRCNARLVNKLLTKHKTSDGMLTDAVAPVDFSKLTLQLETGDNNLELHTSAHCFFRIWDSRIAQHMLLADRHGSCTHSIGRKQQRNSKNISSRGGKKANNKS